MLDQEGTGGLEGALAGAIGDLGYGIAVLEQGGRLRYVNDLLCDLLGYSREELLALDGFASLVAPEVRDAAVQRVVHRFDGEPPAALSETMLLTREGQRVPVEGGARVMEVDGERLTVALVRDISIRLAQEAQRIDSLTRLRAANDERRRLLAALVRAQEEERQRIAYEVHDDPIQAMIAVGMRLDVLRHRATDPRLAEQLRALEEVTREATGRLRRLLYGLRPTLLDSDGLVAALEAHLRAWREEDPETELTLSAELPLEPPREVRTILYRVAQEALANIRKHARARRVRIRVEERAGGVLLAIEDDGVGFRPEEHPEGTPGHLGMISMRERTELGGGRWQVHSRPGAGTVVECWMPLEVITSLAASLEVSA
jgi:PAS domain S-box-containing protein